jgi:hypothetical protein
LCLNGFVEITGHAGFSFFGERALDLSPATGTGDGPADSAGIFSQVDAVIRSLDSRRANADVLGLVSARLPSAFHKLPAIESVLWHGVPPFSTDNP